MGLFGKKTPPDRAASPARKSTASTGDWLTNMANEYKASPAGKEFAAKIDSKIAKNAWESNNAKMASEGAALHAEKYNKPEPKKAETGSWVTAEGGRAINTERM
jgi:hypothetical protein